MKKIIILWGGMFLMMATSACDQGAGNGCNGPGGFHDNIVREVPICGEGVIYSNGIYQDDPRLFVDWTGPEAPTKPSNIPGFSDTPGVPRPLNAYTWTLVSFGNHVYAGIYNRLNDPRSDVPDTSEGGEIWRYKPGATVNSGIWQQEVVAGFGNLTNLGIRIMAVYNNQLFAGTHNLDQGAELWRRTMDTADRTGQWQVISVAGFDSNENNSVRSMAVFNGKLYLGTANNESGAKLYKFDATTDALFLVSKIGEKFKKANVVSELVPIGDYMWIFTLGVMIIQSDHAKYREYQQ